MARARNIKPGFFSSDELAECSPMARLLFIGLWTIADREGRLEDRPKRIKGQVFPYDNCDIDALIDELAKRKFVVRYEVDGHKLLHIPMFKKHQRPHVNELASTLPSPGQASTTKVASTCNLGDKHFALNEELGIRNDERGNINEELGNPPVATCGDVSGSSGKPVKFRLNGDEIDDAVGMAIAMRRKVHVSNHEEAFALCRIAALQVRTLNGCWVEDAAEQTWKARPREPPAYFVETILSAADDRGEPLRDLYKSIMFPRERVREVLEAEVLEKSYR
jgi:hypothetical protein